MTSIKRKNMVFDKYVKCNDSHRKITFHSEYKALRNQIKQIIKDSRKSYYTKYFENNNSNLKKVWLGIKEIINIKSKNTAIPTCIIQNKITHSDPKHIANSFNNYFSTIANSILEERKYDGNKSFKDFMPKSIKNSFAFDPVDEIEILSIISQIKKTKPLVLIVSLRKYYTLSRI